MKITLNKVLSILAGLIGVAALFLFLATPLILPGTEIMGHMTPDIELAYSDVFFGGEHYSGAIAGFIGFILMGVGGLTAILSAFIGKKGNKIITLLGVIMMLTGAVLVFLTKTFFLSANGANDIPGVDLSKGLALGIGTIIGGIMGIASSLVGIVSIIIPNKKASKKRRK